MIHVLDVLTVRPGHLGTVRERVQESYQPTIESLGARLAHRWIAPPVELLDDPVELLLLWEFEDRDAYWQVRLRSQVSDPIAAFWREVQPMLVGRSRRIMVDPDDPTVIR